MTDRMPETLPQMLAQAVTADTGAAIVYGSERLAYRDLEAQSKRAAAGLAAAGIGVGDRVAFWLPNTPAYLVLYFACARLGAIAVAVNTRFRASEVEDVLGRTGAKALIMWPGFRGIDFPGILEGVDRTALGRLETAILYAEDGAAAEALPGVAKTISYGALFDAGHHEEDAATPGLGCNTFTTSGTTKAPKFVLHSHASMACHAAEVAADFGYADPATVIQQDMPLCGVFGITGVLAAIAAARPLILTSA
ncbi:MAG: AMP-binding protein, partial [Pseudomonadota bacterium]|nr:AMP-binding protein [Pseudomonadota bacterium]